jgi:hypothetical protein
MISIAVVDNDELALNEISPSTLESEAGEPESIQVADTQGQCESAAEPLNYGGKQANKECIMFIPL